MWSLLLTLGGLASPCVAVNIPVPGCMCTGNMQTPHANGTISTVSNGLYPASYASQCGVQPEPGQPSCSNADGTPKPKDQQASWCLSPWCYVDPCTCDLADLETSAGTGSSFFASPPLYWSYSNCGGQDTYSSTVPIASSVNASCPHGNYTPVEECLQKLDNEATKISCGDDWAVNGMCVQPPGMNVTYPANYGEGCGVHLEPGYSECSHPNGTAKAPADQADWCLKPWSYVNPCTCTLSDMTRSVTFAPKLLFFSSSACGATDTFTTAATKSSDTADANCPSPPPPATMENPMRLPRSKPVDQKCECVAATSKGVPEVNCNTSFAQDGKCVNATKLNGFYPPNYGSSCGVQLEPLDSSCFDLSTGLPWAAPCRYGYDAGCRASYCDSPWCYVDPCTCSDDNASDIGESTYFGNVGLYYSYSNCKGTDTYSSTPTNLNRSSICDGADNTDNTDNTDTKGSTSFAARASADLLFTATFLLVFLSVDRFGQVWSL